MTVSFFEYKCNHIRYIKVKGNKKMKLITTNTAGDRGLKSTQTGAAWQNGYAASCQKVLAQIASAKEDILTESRQATKAPERLVRLAVNEAEALAWQTAYPQLVFPALATEKVQAVVAWNAAQASVRRASPIFTLAY